MGRTEYDAIVVLDVDVDLFLYTGGAPPAAGTLQADIVRFGEHIAHSLSMPLSSASISYLSPIYHPYKMLAICFLSMGRRDGGLPQLLSRTCRHN